MCTLSYYTITCILFRTTRLHVYSFVLHDYMYTLFVLHDYMYTLFVLHNYTYTLVLRVLYAAPTLLRTCQRTLSGTGAFFCTHARLRTCPRKRLHACLPACLHTCPRTRRGPLGRTDDGTVGAITRILANSVGPDVP